MPRPKTHDKRDRQLNIALRADEIAALQARADARGMRLVDFARAALLTTSVRAYAVALPSRFDRLVHEQLKRIGNNLNQIARKLNAFGNSPQPELEACLTEVRRLIRKADCDDS
jgi:hypothetical protein